MISNRFFFTVLAFCMLTWLLAITGIPLIDIDASQYASMSREMLGNGSYLQLYDLQQDYLDKPPMLFWLSAISMKLFGVYDWAYRLPSFLFALLAVYSTYRLALLFYHKTIAQLSVLVLATSQAMFLIVHDVRCDTMLMGWVTFSLWQLAAWYEHKKWKYFLAAFIAVAGGMMTKGPIALLVPVFAFLPHFVLRREWKQFLRWEYLVALLIIAILLLPMSIGLYQQFDQHPGKLIRGVPIQSGLRFFYWTQSFGRYTGENVFNEMNHFTFLLENMLWSFLPWIVCFLLALVLVVKELVRKKFRIAAGEEWIMPGGFILTYCILARSQAQLPHYIFVVFPLAAIITAKFLYRLIFTEMLVKWRKPLFVIHAVIFALLWIAVIGLMAIPFKTIPWYATVAAALGLLFFLILVFKPRKGFPQLLRVAFFTVIGVNIFLNTAFYPNLLQYQMGNTAAAFINKKQLDKNKLVLYDIHESRALHFYGKHIFARKNDRTELHADDILITHKESIPGLQRQFPAMKVIFEGEYYGVSMLTLPFLNPKTRSAEVTRYAIADLDGKP